MVCDSAIDSCKTTAVTQNPTQQPASCCLISYLYVISSLHYRMAMGATYTKDQIK